MFKYLIILGLILVAWCPWFEKEAALRVVDAKVAKMEASIPDLCQMSVHRDTIKKVPFGYTEKVSYDCKATDPEYGILQATDVVFITFYKGLIGMPEKTVTKNFRLVE